MLKTHISTLLDLPLSRSEITMRPYIVRPRRAACRKNASSHAKNPNHISRPPQQIRGSPTLVIAGARLCRPCQQFTWVSATCLPGKHWPAFWLALKAIRNWEASRHLADTPRRNERNSGNRQGSLALTESELCLAGHAQRQCTVVRGLHWHIEFCTEGLKHDSNTAIPTCWPRMMSLSAERGGVANSGQR